jgi:hypothetical protein
MKKFLKYTFYVLLVVFIAIQLVPAKRPAVSSSNPNDFLLAETVPLEVANILRSACYDCHSNETKYPWYTNIAPVKWMMYDHINEGRDELNFSEWTTFSPKRKARKMEEVAEEVEEGHMPEKSYTWMHKEARLSDEQKEVLVNWAKEMHTRLKAVVPAE